MTDIVQWPHRRVRMTFDHETAGDELFVGLIYTAMSELRQADPRGMRRSFTASNGVTITIEPLTGYDNA